MPGGFFHGKAAEKPEFDDASLDGIELFQRRQSIVEIGGVDAMLKQGVDRLIEHSASKPLLRLSALRRRA